jgi:hypothetical protein
MKQIKKAHIEAGGVRYGYESTARAPCSSCTAGSASTNALY